MAEFSKWFGGLLPGRLAGTRDPLIRYDSTAAPRLLCYCASNIGMGHMGRVVRVMRRLRQLRPDCNLLLVTDAKNLALTRGGDDLAVVKLPSFEFVSGGQYGEQPQALGLTKHQLLDIRRTMLLALVRSYQPSLVYMDSLPHGKRDEMLPALRLARKQDARTALCMRDIPCAPGEKFKLAGNEAQLRKHLALYDRLLVAGDQGFFDLAMEYGWPDWVLKKLSYVGFVVPKAPEVARDRAPGKPQRIVASFGGGWEATELANEIIEALETLSDQGLKDWHLTLFTGPAIAAEDYAVLEQRIRTDDRIRLERLSAEFPTLLAGADLAILQAGSTPFQILDSDIPMIVYHRDYKIDEQACRARLLARLPGIELLDRSMLGGVFFTEKIRAGLMNPRTPRQTGFDFDGIENATRILLELLKA